MSKLWYESWAQNRNEALPVGNGRVGALVCEMLLQSDKTGIYTLPALPKAWEKRLCAGLKNPRWQNRQLPLGEWQGF